MVSAVAKLSPTAWPISSLKYGKCHLSGDSITPSSDRNSAATTFLMASPLLLPARTTLPYSRRGSPGGSDRPAPQASLRNERPDPFVAQEETAPRQHPDEGREQKPRDLHAHLGCHGAAEVARQKDRAEEGRARNGVEGRADEQGHADPEDGPRGVAEPGGGLDDGVHHHGLGDPVEGQKRDHEGAHDAARPQRVPRRAPGRSARGLDRCLSVHLHPPSVFLHRLEAVYRVLLFFATTKFYFYSI